MQIAALNPRFWDKTQVTQDVLDEEKKIMMAQMDNDPKMASKPEQVTREDRHGQAEQVLFRELPAPAGVRPQRRCSLSTVEQYIADAAKKLGGKIKLRGRRPLREGRGHREEAGELRRRDRFHDQGLRLPRANNTEAGHGSVRPLFLCRTTKKRRFIFAGAMQQKLQKSL